MSTDVSDSFENIPKRCIAIRTMMTARAVARHYDEALRDTGLTNNQFSLLVAISLKEFPSMAALGDLLCIDRSTLSRNFRPLFEAGYVTRERSEKGRAIVLKLTDMGLEKLKEAEARWEAAQLEIEQAMPDEDMQAGKRFLRSLRLAASHS